MSETISAPDLSTVTTADPRPVVFVASGGYDWASARIRAYWPARYMTNTVVINQQDLRSNTFDLGTARAVVFQKIADAALMETLRNRGIAVYWDLCDPVHWFSPFEARKILPSVDGVICSSTGLAQDFTAWSGKRAICIPDRLDLEHYKYQRVHSDADPVRLIWYGIAINRVGLYAALANLDRLHANGYKFTLTIYDDKPGQHFVTTAYPVGYGRWTIDAEPSVIAGHDIALLPPYPGPWGWVKSNNRQLTAWACGIPDTTGMNYAELVELVTSADRRTEQAAQAYDHLQTAYDVRQSAAEWEKLLC